MYNYFPHSCQVLSNMQPDAICDAVSSYRASCANLPVVDPYGSNTILTLQMFPLTHLTVYQILGWRLTNHLNCLMIQLIF